MKKVLIIAFACVVALNMWAERVSQEDAAVVANNFMNVAPAKSAAKRMPAKRMVLKANSESSEPQYYIYENANGEGWVMVAANDVVRPILAYSHTGSFRTDNMPKNVKGWLQGYQEQIAYSAQHSTRADAKVQREWLRLRSGVNRQAASVVVAPLIQTGWDQAYPYWNLCPMKSDDRCLTGCVATAMAQVMKYWEWPKQGTGSHTIPGTTYSADFGATTYDWANMKNSYSGSSTAAQKTAVATLMYHCGVAADMEYGTSDEGGSGAYTIDWNGYWSSSDVMCAEYALKTFFGYNPNTVKGHYRNGSAEDGMRSWTRSEWIAMLKAELDAQRPIMYSGCGYNTPGDESTVYGHSFICDGYDSNDYFHFNWGWSNWCDGYYDVDALNTNDPGSGGGNGEYNYKQDVIIGIQPSQDVVHVTGVSVSPASLTLKIKESAELTTTVLPNNATYKSVSWSSDNTAVAKVSTTGVVTGLAAGTAHIIATTNDGNHTDTCDVTVTNEVVPSIELVVDYGWARYETSDDSWIVIVADDATGIPWVQFYFDSGSANKIAGTYDLAYGVYLWNNPENEDAYVQATSGQLNITCVGKDDGASGCNTYHISASFTCSDELDYTLDATLELCGEDEDDVPIDLADEVGDGSPVYYNVRFYDKGVQVGETQSVLKNGQAVPPADPEACDGYTFAGWWGAILPEDNTTAHEWTTDFKVTCDTAFYAIYSRTETEENESSSVTFTAGTDVSNTLTLTKGGVTITLTDGTLSRDDNYRCYANYEMTVSATAAMTEIVMNCSESGTTKGGPGCFSAPGYSYSEAVGTWTGNATSVTFAASKQVRINSMTVTLNSLSTTYYSSESCSSSTDIENTTIVPVAQKLLRNGQIVIIRGEAVYTITGERIQ